MNNSDATSLSESKGPLESHTVSHTHSAHVVLADRNALALGGLRIAVGLLFLVFAEYKVLGTEFTQGGFEGWINRFLQDGAYPFMVPVLKGLVLPHGRAVAFLVAYGELAIGVALVSGVLVRIASAFGFIYMMSLLFSSNYPGPQAPLWQFFGASLDHSVLALCFLTFVFGQTEQRLSVAKYLSFRRRPAAL